MIYRNEIKHVIDAGDRAAIIASLRRVAKPDPHAGKDGCYLIRSLYFDNLADRALREKKDGVNEREKFRIRFYNGDTGFIRLEKKVKRNGLGCKLSTPMSAEEARRIIDGDTPWMAANGQARSASARPENWARRRRRKPSRFPMKPCSSPPHACSRWRWNWRSRGGRGFIDDRL